LFGEEVEEGWWCWWWLWWWRREWVVLFHEGRPWLRTCESLAAAAEKFPNVALVVGWREGYVKFKWWRGS
jgi:hypothetical protein